MAGWYVPECECAGLWGCPCAGVQACRQGERGPRCIHVNEGERGPRCIHVTCAHAQGELLDTVPALREANAKWMHEVHVLQERLDEARALHARQLEQCEQQAAAAVAFEKEALASEREQWKRCHQRHMEVERKERKRLEAQVKLLEAQNAHLQEQNGLLQTSCANTRGAAPKDPARGRVALLSAIADSSGDADEEARQLAQAEAQIEELKAQVSAGRSAVDEVRRRQQQVVMELASSLAQERKEVQRLGAEAAAHRALACSLQEQQAHCARITSTSLRANDPERLYVKRPPMLDAHNSRVSLPPGAHGLWQACAFPPALP